MVNVHTFIRYTVIIVNYGRQRIITMTKSERNQIIKWANNLTDEELEEEYFTAVWNTLGSDAEEMYERGYDIQDIIEREKYEKWLGQRADLIEQLCYGRGIEPWKHVYE